MTRKLIILPTYNEAENVLPLIDRILPFEEGYEVLVVDDNSPDGTGDIVAERAKVEPRVSVHRRPGKLGLGTAYLAGFRHGLDHGYDHVLTMDCDHSHDPVYLPAITAAMEKYDVVIGSRYVPGGGIENWPWHRQALSAFANFYARTLLGITVHDCTSGFRCYSRKVLENADPFAIRASGYSFLEEMAWRVSSAGFTLGEVPIVFVQRNAGVSKIDSSEIYRAAWHVLMTGLRKRPPRSQP